MSEPAQVEQSSKRWWLLLLIIPFIGTLWPPFYAKASPMLDGIPFFYWYQFLWVIIAVVITGIVYFLVHD